jgi:hypothetical protein
MSRTKNPDERWLWFSSRTSLSVPLDPAAYPSTLFDGHPMPFPDWACRAPNGAVHIDNRRGRIDIDVAKAPNGRVEFSWCDPFGVHVLARRWLADIEDLVDERTVFVGDVRRKGRRLDNWATLHQKGAPILLSSDGWANFCPICGASFSALWGRLFFADPSVIGRPLIVHTFGVFVREDLALSRNLRRPEGGFKPRVVRFLSNPPPFKPPLPWAAAPAPPEPPAAPSGWRGVASAIWKKLRS